MNRVRGHAGREHEWPTMLWDAGGVSPRGDDAYPVPTRLYRSLGFRECARSLGYRCPA
ncbi:hypothetical protein [Microbispora bryophytorum]|uniref:Uncharacterized protein n=1 Tax=Microbispora bryophytorum TaxID=1460882 RepID=A0A8H9H301_9ACTN|nr:hypothetical protein [Microbispora bryophytorum]MBD3139389.1 hypothetical protein [Microbispora bryophytorum]GGO23296.1 hypothetical protein GCM10011574_52440 [Microbispora bryophytorum]